LSYLKNGRQVVKRAVGIFDGEAYLNTEATTTNLMLFGTRSKILQLYTHAVSSDSSYNSSYIYLHDRRMFVDEIINLPLQTNLCLLTACEVGLGKNYSGEGVTSVAWAFRAAGAQNVVQSLWKLNESKSADLMTVLFENLKSGFSSNVALSKAKQDYLGNPETSSRLKHPYYWAGMSHYGLGTRAESGYSSWFAILALTLGALTVFAIRRIAKR
jgi:CHAT domain-containing protein